MKNMVVLYKNDDGDLHCRQLTEEGRRHVRAERVEGGTVYWEDGGTVLPEELEEILNREI